MTSNSTKKFGLILAGARRQEAAAATSGVISGVRKLNVLRNSDDELEDDDEEEEEQNTMDWVQASLKKSGGGNSAQLAQQQRLMREALAQDASVFHYDELYDDMQEKRQATKQAKQAADKKPKYIHTILKTAERRKLEGERRTERKVQAEREAEQGMYDDKESFVTASYLKKMEELKKAEAQEKVDLIIEERNESKNKNFSVFYNHLFKQRMGDITIKKESENIETKDKEEKPSEEISIKKRDERSRGNQYRRQMDIDDSPTHQLESSPQTRQRSCNSSSSECDTPAENKTSQHEKYVRRKSQYRSSPTRRSSSPQRKRSRSPHRKRSRSPHRKRSRSPYRKRSGSPHRKRSRSPHRESSRSPHRSKRSSSKSQTKTKLSRSKSPKLKPKTSIHPKTKDSQISVKEEPSSPTSSSDNGLGSELRETSKTQERKKSNESKDNTELTEDTKKPKETREERIKRLFTKRAVGQMFIDAQQRYYDRKAEKETNATQGL